ncbi:hypothetical protein [Rhizobium sp. YTU87027]|uniref:hypothetical protein n=1 Tax=Rhizobium sp. YTU87027 TaxID=3417741 RepID=UPI003D685901
MLDFGESTASLSYLLDPALLFPPAIVYADGDDGDDEIVTRTSDISRLVAEHFRAYAETHAPKATFDQARPVEVKAQDTWLWNTVSSITAHRQADWMEPGVEAPSEEALDVAEVLAAGFAQLPINRRPQFGVDGDGRASFSAYDNGFYLHLTIDQGGAVSWYSVENDAESYRDDVEVDPLNVRALAEEIMSA